MIKISADSQIPEIENQLEEYFNAEFSLKLFSSDKLSNNDLKDIDILIVRSTLLVNQSLCEGTSISYVASATAGIDHLDVSYLESQNIGWSYAPGCNTSSVIHYVMTVFGELIKDGLFNVRQSIGILGYGNIGKRLYMLLKALNFEVYACDPFLTDPELVNLDRVLECDLLTIHVPLSIEGPHPTFNLINQSHKKILSNKILINTSRGEIVSEDFLSESQDLIYIADVWKNEPNPELSVVKKAYIATPHIAGYSEEGKLNGAKMIVEKCAKKFKCLKHNSYDSNSFKKWPHGLQNIVGDIHGLSFPLSLFNSELDIRSISDSFKALSAKNLEDGFKDLRANHPQRHDFNSYSFNGINKFDEELDLRFFDYLRGA